MGFNLQSDYQIRGDQPQAISEIVQGFKKGENFQTLLGVTGSGKTFTMANVINEIRKPTLVLSHNKTLAAQLHSEFKEFFPKNSVEYFVSYYDYYQPEAYVSSTDTYIEKDSQINDEIDKLRHSATSALIEREDVIIVASVSAIYGLGSPFDYINQTLSIRIGSLKPRDEIIKKLVQIQYTRNDMGFVRGNFRIRGDIIDIFPSGSKNAIRLEFFGDEIDDIKEINPLTGDILARLRHIAIYPASHYVTSEENIEKAIKSIEEELESRIKFFKDNSKLIEAQRIEERTRYDIEMLREVGTCKGIENYSRHLNQLEPNKPPFTLLDYFPDDFLLVVDESHVMVPQLRGMYRGDRSRKNSLVDYGFRLPSALDNRPLKFEEFEKKINRALFVSATPAEYEIKKSDDKFTTQIIRPTGLLDPVVDVVKSEGQIDNLIYEIRTVVSRGEKVLVTTLTKKMSESLTNYLKDYDIKVRYLHSEIDTLERLEIVRDLRLGVYDVLVGINLLREGLDIPEVSLVAILDGDKEGFLRTETSLIQTMGRAARHVNGRVIIYADRITRAMENAIRITTERRKLQMEYNDQHDIIPKTIEKPIRDLVEITIDETIKESDIHSMTQKELKDYIKNLEKAMKTVADNLEFEKAAELRDEIIRSRKELI